MSLRLSLLALLPAAALMGSCASKAIDKGICTEADNQLFDNCLNAGCSPSKSNSAQGLDTCEGEGSALTQSGSGECAFEGSGSCYIICDCNGAAVDEEEDSGSGIDIDGDGIPAEDDCDDGDASKPTYDADCDGTRTEDDCDDSDPALNNGDADSDGSTTCGGDCDDDDAARQALDADGDGFSTCDGDCDDTRDWLYPYDGDGNGSLESCGYRDIAAGVLHVCALGSDGSPVCWGDNAYGQLDPPDGLVLDRVYGGGWTTCGLDDDGQIVCWGEGSSGGILAGVPAGRFDYVGVSAGAACAVSSEGQLSCWGSEHADDSGLTTNEPTGTWTQVSVPSFQSACAVSTSGAVSCWGADRMAIEGAGLGSGAFELVRRAAERICGLSTSGEVVCSQSSSVSGALPVSHGATGVLDLDMFGSGSAWDTCIVDADAGVECTFLTFPVGSYSRVVMSDQSRFACALTVGGEAVCACPPGASDYACSPP